MDFWCVLVLVPLLILAVLFFLRPTWIPLAVPLSALVVLASFWDLFSYYESRPLVVFFLCLQEAAVAAAALLLCTRRVPARRSRCFLTLASYLFTMMSTVVPCRYLDLLWASGFHGPHPAPGRALLWLIPFAAGILLALVGAWKAKKSK